jgi:hypothetical protein
MKPPHLNLGVILLMFAGDLFGQTNQARLFLPFLDKESQSNVIVSIYFNGNRSCPLEFTNVLSNTNLFSPEEQKLIKKVLVKYQNVTTNSGPAGTILAGLYKTNFMVKTIDGPVEIKRWVARFQYTNFEAHEMIYFGRGELEAEFRTKANDGYNTVLTAVGGGSVLHFKEVERNLLNGVCAVFNDNHDQGPTWNYWRTDFSDARLEVYMQYTNGMNIGQYLMWNPQNGYLLVEADFKEPYDFEKHQIDSRPPQ